MRRSKGRGVAMGSHRYRRPRSARRAVTAQAGSGSMRRARRRRGTIRSAPSRCARLRGRLGRARSRCRPARGRHYAPARASDPGAPVRRAGPARPGRRRLGRKHGHDRRRQPGHDPRRNGGAVFSSGFSRAISSAWPSPSTSDADGRFTIRGAGRNIRVGLVIDDPRFARQRTQSIPMDPRIPRT